MKIPNVIVFSDYITSVCSYWRSQNPFSELAREGKINLIIGDYNKEDWTTLRICDIAFFQRPVMNNVKNQILMAKDMKVKGIWIDLDDSNNIPIHHPIYGIYKSGYDELSFKKIMIVADIVTTTTQYLKNIYLKYTNNIQIIPNALNDYWLDFSPSKRGKNIFLRAGDHHEHDIYEYKDCIIDVMNNHKDWKLIVCGSNPIFLQQEIENYIYSGDYNIHDYFAYILQSNCSIFILPLLKNELNFGKSNIGWLEATLSGASSLTPNYWKLHNYSLTYKDKKTFKENLEKLITDENLRKELWTKSVQKVKKDYLLSKVNNKRMDIIKNLMK